MQKEAKPVLIIGIGGRILALTLLTIRPAESSSPVKTILLNVMKRHSRPYTSCFITDGSKKSEAEGKILLHWLF